MSRSVCTVDGCQRLVAGRGLCKLHWQRWRRHGDPTVRHEYWPERMLWRLDELLNRGWSDERIGQAFGKSASTVKKVRLRYGLKAGYRQAHTAREISRIMGVNCMVPGRWIRDGRLKARKNGARYGRYRVYQITHTALLEFLEEPAHWHCWEPEPITDRYLRRWALELRGDVRFIPVKEAAARLGVAQSTVTHWLATGKLQGGRDGGIIWVADRSVAELEATP